RDWSSDVCSSDLYFHRFPIFRTFYKKYFYNIGKNNYAYQYKTTKNYKIFGYHGIRFGCRFVFSITEKEWLYTQPESRCIKRHEQGYFITGRVLTYFSISNI